MSMSWIKIRTNLRDDPRVISIATCLGVHRDLVVGKLVVFWSWADQHTSDGNALSVTLSFLDELVSCPRFSENLQKVGWLAGNDGNISIPNFEEHNGQSAKRRSLTSKRVSVFRQSKMYAKCNAVSVNSSSSSSSSNSDKKEGSEEGNQVDLIAVTPVVKEKRIPTVEEWIECARAKDPLWPTGDIRQGWTYYEARGWKDIQKWRMCVSTCYNNWKKNNRIP